MLYPNLQLKPRSERRLQAGHLWIFSNEIDNAATPLKSFAAGSIVRVVTANNEPFGLAYINPQCLLCARILTRDVNETIDQAFFVRRVQQALKMRESFFAKPYYRLIYSDSDLLSGLIVDRYDDTLVLQINTAGMEKLRDVIVAALKEVLKPARIILRNDSSYRAVEGLPEENKILFGDESPLRIEENNTIFEAPVTSGQKTGWFYDHRQNRTQLLSFVKNKRVLDVYSYLGAWGIACATHGASEVVCVDSSKAAIEQLTKNATLNKVEKTIRTVCGDAFRVLQEMLDKQERFDIVIVDPPAFIKSKKDFNQGVKGYLKLNRLALQLLKPQGMLVSAACSMHLERNDLVSVISGAAAQVSAHAQIVHQGAQGFDHPVHPAIPETNYLKAYFVAKV